jgi:hypothetical protein
MNAEVSSKAIAEALMYRQFSCNFKNILATTLKLSLHLIRSDDKENGGGDEAQDG